jgi:hypothetical protein
MKLGYLSFFRKQHVLLIVSLVFLTGFQAAATPPSVSILSHTNGSAVEVFSLFGVSASASDSDGSVVNVEFYLDATYLGNDSSSPYFILVPGQASGTRLLRAVATDNSGAKATNGVVIYVENLPSVSFLSPPNGANYIAPTTLVVSVFASDSDGTLSRLEFFSGTNRFGVLTNPVPFGGTPFIMVLSNAVAGNYPLWVKATDNLGGTRITVTNTVNVNFLLKAPEAVSNQFQFSAMNLAPDKTNLIQASENLGVWTTIKTNIGPLNGPFVDKQASNYSSRYYRVRQLP